MAKVSNATLKKYVLCIKKAKEKYLTVDMLSHYVGVYPDIISSQLSMFDPMINIDTNYDVRSLLPAMEKYLSLESPTKSKKIKNKPLSKSEKEASRYDSIQDFIYQNMTLSGMMDKSAPLSDEDLIVLKKLISEEQNKRKINKHKSHR